MATIVVRVHMWRIEKLAMRHEFFSMRHTSRATGRTSEVRPTTRTATASARSVLRRRSDATSEGTLALGLARDGIVGATAIPAGTPLVVRQAAYFFARGLFVGAFFARDFAAGFAFLRAAPGAVPVPRSTAAARIAVTSASATSAMAASSSTSTSIVGRASRFALAGFFFVGSTSLSRPLAVKLLDGSDDGVLVADLARDDALVLAEVLSQVLDELPRAVRALDLAVSEHVHARQELVLHQLDAEERVVHRPVVAVGEVERVDVPLVGRVVVVDELAAQLVRARDHRPAALARVEERVAVDLARHGVVDDVAALEALVLALQPRVDPEALDAHDLLLLVAHRAGDVHHVDDDGVGDGLGLGLPAPVALVARDGDDDGVRGHVRAHRDLALERLAVRPLEVAQRLGADAADARVAVLRVDDLALALVLDVRELELLAQDGRKLVERDVHLQRVLAGSRARLLALAPFVPVAVAADRVARI